MSARGTYPSGAFDDYPKPSFAVVPNEVPVHNCHIRFTPVGQEFDLSGLLVNTVRYIVSKEQATKEHYHICFETKQCEETIRARVLTTLKIPKTGRGQGNTHYCLKWDKYKNWTPDYAAKSGDIVSSLGFTPDEIEDAIWRGSIKYNKQVDTGAKGTSIDITNGTHQVTNIIETRPQCEFDRLLIAFEKSEHRELDCVNIKRWIKSYYLKQRKAIPRDGDLKRYAYSMYAIVHNKTSLDDQLVLETTQEIYL